MNKLVIPFLLVLFCTFCVPGCDLAPPPPPEPVERPVVPPPEPPKQEEPVQKEDDTQLVQAAPGMTGRGTSYDTSTNNPMSIITVPIATLFSTQERLVLMNIEHAMNLYKAEHDRIPSSHEEFMREIIQNNNIQLPRLPEGQTYVYDPSDGLLKVRKPRD